ncbi:hypothetical protein [Methyloversatilis discipulorum]|uniref:hypothetical protein n=1 Tax=Methyloversatilis discipulorum TaxID=1119528 RepID=UPI003137CB9A
MGDLAEALRKIGARDLAGGGMTQGVRPPFEEKPAKGAKPPAVARAKAQSSGGGGGDLSELSATSRTYWPAQTIVSSDGIFSVQIDPIKSVTLTDGRKINFAEPSDV